MLNDYWIWLFLYDKINGFETACYVKERKVTVKWLENFSNIKIPQLLIFLNCYIVNQTHIKKNGLYVGLWPIYYKHDWGFCVFKEQLQGNKLSSTCFASNNSNLYRYRSFEEKISHNWNEGIIIYQWYKIQLLNPVSFLSMTVNQMLLTTIDLNYGRFVLLFCC